MKTKRIKVPILWEKKYVNSTFFDNSHDFQGKLTGKWGGLAIIYHFYVLQYTNKNILRIEPEYEEFGGTNHEEMVDGLEKLVGELEEWDLKDKHYKNAEFYPVEVESKLKELNVKK
jgi:hypothetical protein